MSQKDIPLPSDGMAGIMRRLRSGYAPCVTMRPGWTNPGSRSMINDKFRLAICLDRKVGHGQFCENTRNALSLILHAKKTF
jgi:hypothetical protein